ncbi:PaaI family thioesterase [Erythrobacteraceae bacterium E2-1 Yellow Sea]|nr:PaaI family thioesterase [Erythrobacteraceae bacterium E2-1 Yellow Sea]
MLGEAFQYGPDPDNPGWHSWNVTDQTIFNAAVMGHMITRQEGDKCRLRMVPQRHHLNMQGFIHGAVIQSLIDISLFASIHVLELGSATASVTLEVSTQFVGTGDPSKPLDAINEVVRETGRLVFFRGDIVQGEARVAAFSAIVRKFSVK